MICFGYVLTDTSMLSAAKGSPGKPTAEETRIVDSTGKTVGQLLGTFRRGSGTEDLPLIYADVALLVNGQSFVVTVDKSRSYGNIELYFTGANCTGQAYFSQQKINIGARLFPSLGVHPSSNVAYLPNIAANATTISPLSSTRFDGTGRIFAECQPAAITLVDAIEAIAIGDLSTLYVPPFTLQIAP
jgi:hypothetical protein